MNFYSQEFDIKLTASKHARGEGCAVFLEKTAEKIFEADLIFMSESRSPRAIA